MKILVCVNTFAIGGMEWNSMEVATKLRDDYGHEIILFGSKGPMTTLLQQRGLKFIEAPMALSHPSPKRIAALRAVIRNERPDVVQAWDCFAALDAFYGAQLLMRIPLHIVHGNMIIERMLPKRVPTVFMTPELAGKARALGRGPVGLVCPPIDTERDAPQAVDAMQFREQYQVASTDVLLVTVSRLANQMKGESLRRTIAAVRVLAKHLPIKLVIVGDGEAREELSKQTLEANIEIGRIAVVLAGAQLDPRPAYAAADVVIGMGGSSLRGMAFGKPVIVVGENGFSAQFGPSNAERFYHTGMYGIGDGDTNNENLVRNIRELVERADLKMLGDFSLQFVRSRFRLELAVEKLNALCYRTVAEPPGLGTTVVDALRTAGVCVAGKLVPRSMRRFGRVRREHLAAILKQFHR